jgi:hypothetical protein
MRRIKLVLGALALVVAMFAAFAGPAMADDLDCRNVSGPGIRCDGTRFLPVNNFNNFNDGVFLVNGFNTFPFFNTFGFNGFGGFDGGCAVVTSNLCLG